MVMTNTIEIILSFFPRKWWDDHVTSFRMIQTVYVSAIENNSHVHVVTDVDICYIIINIVATMKKLKLGFNVAVGIHRNFKVITFLEALNAFQFFQ